MKEKDPKTPAQLRREIEYYAEQIERTTSRDRQARAHRAIVTRERLLLEALAVRCPPRLPAH